MNSIPVISHLRWLSPLWCLRHHLRHGVKHVTRFSGRYAPLRIVFPCHPAVSVGRQKESAFMGRLGALLRPTCTSYAGCAQWTTTRALLRVTYENTTSRSFIVPPLAGERWWRQPPKGALFPARKGGLPVFSRAKPGFKGFFILAPQATTTTLGPMGPSVE